MDTTVKNGQAGDRIPMSWDDYEALGPDAKGEYIDGELVVSPGPTRTHQDIMYRMHRLLDDAAGSDVLVSGGWGWKPDQDEFIPDLIVVPVTTDEKRFTGTPLLAVEILSSEPARDTIRKFAKYADAGLERYWIVDPKGPEVIEYALVNEVYVEQQRVVGSNEATLDFGAGTIVLRPVELTTR